MHALKSLFPTASFVEVGPHAIPVHLPEAGIPAGDFCLAFPFAKGLVKLQGKDAQSFVNGQCTAPVMELKPGQGQRAVFPNSHGKILFDAFLWREGAEEMWVVVDPGEEERLLKMFEFYAVTEEVGFEALSGQGYCLFVMEQGQKAPQPQGRLLYQRLEPALSVWWLDSAAEMQRLMGQGLAVIGLDLFDQLRPWFGFQRAGVDFSQEQLPQEAALEEAISLTKGCYLGQEPISRIALRGRVKRRLERLAADSPVADGSPLCFEGKEVGVISSGCQLPRQGRYYVLGYVPTAWKDGHAVEFLEAGSAKLRLAPLK